MPRLLLLSLAFLALPLVHAQEAGTALSLDGAGDYVVLQNFPLADDFTVEAWVDLSTDGSDVIFGKHDGTSTNVFIVGRFSNVFRVIVRGSSLTLGTLPTDGVHHVAVTVRQDLVSGTSEVLGYVDGVLVGTANPGNTVDDGTGDWGSREWLLGQEWDSSASDFLLGTLDEVRMWTRERTPAEIRDAMHTRIESGDASFGDLAAYYRFDAAGATVVDETANGRDGTFVGDATRTESPHPVIFDTRNLQTVSGTGPVTFTGTGLSADFSALSASGDMEAFEFSEAPGDPPAGFGAPLLGRYWVLHAYGNPTFTADLTLDLPGAAFPPELTDIALLARGDGGAWTYVAMASALAGSQVTFADVTEADIDDRALYVVSREDLTLVSTFDTDDEDWRTTPDARRNPLPDFVATGGNPGGYLTASDLASGDVWYFCAPAPFLADQSALYGGIFRYDVKQNLTTSQFAAPDVTLTGRNGTILAFDIEPNPGTDWSPRSVVLLASSGWRVTDLAGPLATETQMQDVLADLDAVCIRGEYRSGSDRGDLDNVYMLPPSVLLEGVAGWRTLSPPFPDLPLGGRDTPGFLQPIYTAGYLGADRDQRNARGLANVFLYDEPTGTFVPPGKPGASVPIETGRGLWVYVEEDDDSYTPGVQGGFPKALSIFGIPLTTDHTFPVTFTASAPPETATNPGPGTNLVGNPYEVDLDWDHAGWTRTNVSSTLYIWDPTANAGMGDFLDWTPGVGGTLASGVIPVGQGFHVEATGADPVLIAPAAARLTTRTKVYGLTGPTTSAVATSKASGVPRVRFTLSDGARESQAWVSLRDDAALGLDPTDGRRLAGARGADALRLYTRIGDGYEGAGAALAVAALPRDSDGPLAIDLHADALRAGAPADARATLAWAPLDLPSGWGATLLDRRTGVVYDLGASGEIDLALASEDVLTASDADLAASKASSLAPPTPRALLARGTARFVVTLTPEAAKDSGAEIRAEVGPLAPNPARAGARLAISLPVSGDVTVEVFDALGRRVALVHNGPLAAGTSRVRVPTTDLVPGAYVVRTSGAVSGTRRFTVVR